METRKTPSWIDQTMQQFLKVLPRTAELHLDDEGKVLAFLKAKFIESYRNGAQAERNRHKGICQPVGQRPPSSNGATLRDNSCQCNDCGWEGVYTFPTNGERS